MCVQAVGQTSSLLHGEAQHNGTALLPALQDEDFVVSEREEGTSSDSESDTSAHGLAKKRSPLLRSKNDADESVLSDSEIEQVRQV